MGPEGRTGRVDSSGQTTLRRKISPARSVALSGDRTGEEPGVHRYRSYGNYSFLPGPRDPAGGRASKMPDPRQPQPAYCEELFYQFVHTVQDHAIFAMDPQGRIVHWNAGAEAIMGFAPDDVVGRELHDIFTEEDCAAGIPRLELETATRMGRAADERWHVRKDGSRFWGLGAVTAIRGPDEALLGYGKIVADRTDLKELQDALQSRNDALAHG